MLRAGTQEPAALIDEAEADFPSADLPDPKLTAAQAGTWRWHYGGAGDRPDLIRVTPVRSFPCLRLAVPWYRERCVGRWRRPAGLLRRASGHKFRRIILVARLTAPLIRRHLGFQAFSFEGGGIP